MEKLSASVCLALFGARKVLQNMMPFPHNDTTLNSFPIDFSAGPIVDRTRDITVAGVCDGVKFCAKCLLVMQTGTYQWFLVEIDMELVGRMKRTFRYPNLPFLQVAGFQEA